LDHHDFTRRIVLKARPEGVAHADIGDFSKPHFAKT
jgi:hypothetical protein